MSLPWSTLRLLKKMNKLLYLLLFITLPVFAQERKPLQGRIMVGDAVVNDLFVINKKTGSEVKTKDRGDFTIDAKNGDVLVVYSNRTEVREFTVSELSFTDVPYIMSVNAKSYELNEVVINQTVTSESLGLIPKGQKRYTPAERRLKTASDFQPSLFLPPSPGIGIPTDVIINAISGRTKMLKKALKTEGKVYAIEMINGLYTEQELRDELLIPAEYTQGFIFYAAEDATCAAALKSRNDDLAKLTIANLALKYRTILQEHE